MKPREGVSSVGLQQVGAMRACSWREGVSSVGLQQEGGCEQCGPAAGGRV